MTDYNDGKLHRWNGDDYPDGVHPESLIWCHWVDVTCNDQGIYGTKKAGWVPWSLVTAFRVTKVYEEKPREYWIYRLGHRLYAGETRPVGDWDEVIRVREVIE